MVVLVFLLMIIGAILLAFGSFAARSNIARDTPKVNASTIILSGVIAIAIASGRLYEWNISTVGSPGRLSSGVVYRVISRTPTEDEKNLVILQDPSGDYRCVLSPDTFDDSVRFLKISMKETGWRYEWELVAVMPFEPRNIRTPN